MGILFIYTYLENQFEKNSSKLPYDPLSKEFYEKNISHVWKMMDEFNPLTKCGQINKLSDDRWISSMNDNYLYSKFYKIYLIT